MKLIYIVGLEHSGTTLTDHLLSCHPRVIGLGEVGMFFSPSHMKTYRERWDRYEDAYLCSCGSGWGACEFWGPIRELSGLESDLPLEDKYRRLLEHARNIYGDDATLVDSSKSLGVLQAVLRASEHLGLDPGDIRVVFAIKDARGFVVSIKRKQNGRTSFTSALRTLNYWTGANKSILRYLQSREASFVLSLYEELCSDPDAIVARILSGIGLEASGEANPDHRGSHIALGNKNFLMRNRNRIVYDSRWFHDDTVNLAYLAHFRARQFNREIHELARAARRSQSA